MTTIRTTPDAVEVRLTTRERIAALHGHLRVPRSAVASAEVVAEGLGAVRGLRAPGLALPGRVKAGTWRGRAGRRFVLVRRGVPALRLRLHGHRYDEVLVSTPDAAALAAELGAVTAVTAAEREVRVPTDGPTLVGTLTVPDGVPGQAPAALLLTGSGPLDRDGNHRRLRLDIQRQLATALAATGTASLRYDRRGVGASGGSFLSAGLHDGVRDAAAALDALRAQPEVDPDRVVVVGHSEGAVLATSLAAGGAPVAGLVLLGPTARPGADVLLWQARAIAPTVPAPVRLLLRVLRTDLVTRVARTHDRIRATTTDTARIGLTRLNARWHREFLAHDPAQDLPRVTVPVLAVAAGKDLQTPPEDADAVARLAAGPVDVLRIDDLSHVLRSQPGRPTLQTYRRDLRRPVDPRVLDGVVRWVAGVRPAGPGRATAHGRGGQGRR